MERGRCQFRSDREYTWIDPANGVVIVLTPAVPPGHWWCTRVQDGDAEYLGRAIRDDGVPYILDRWKAPNDIACWRTKSSPAQTTPPFQPLGTKPTVIGVVYFIQAENGMIKVGWAADAESRLEALRGMSPCPLQLLATVTTHRTTEARFHRELSRWRSHGEWFYPSAEVMAVVERVRQI